MELVNEVEKPTTIQVSNEAKSKTQLVIHDDCIKKMMEMDANRVDIIICDPPYNIGKDFGNDSDKQLIKASKNGEVTLYSVLRHPR